MVSRVRERAWTFCTQRQSKSNLYSKNVSNRLQTHKIAGKRYCKYQEEGRKKRKNQKKSIKKRKI